MDKPRGQWTTVTWLPFREEVIGGGAKSIEVDLGAAAFIIAAEQETVTGKLFHRYLTL